MKIWPILVAVAVLLAPAVTKACTLPAGVEGQFLFNHDYNLVQYCDANNVWVRLGGSTTDARIGTFTANKWCAANAGGTGLDCTQNAPTAGITALTGDVTASGSGSVVATIAANAVTYAKIQNTSAASVLLGRGSASGAGVVQELTLGAGLSLSGTTLSATASGTVSGTTNYVAKFTGATSVGNSQIFDNGTSVGIGTTSPGMKLDVNGNARVGNGSNFATNDGGLLLYSNNAYKIGFDANGGAPYSIRYNVDVADSSHGHIFSAGPIASPTNLMTIRGDGNVGIGTTSPASVLHVKGAWGGIHGMAEFTSTNASLIRINDQSQTSPAGEWLFGTDNDQFKIYRHNAAGEVNNWVQKLVLDSGGNLGIGTISPLTKLHVSAGDITVENGNAGSGGDGGRIVFRVGAAGDTIGAAAIKSLNTYASEVNGQSGNLAFYTNLRTGTNAYTGLTEKMRITDSGTLLLNNTDGPYGPAKMSIAFAGNTSWGLSIKDTTSSDGAAAMAFWFGNSQVGYVQLHSGSTTYNTTSDRRLKENIADTSRGLAKLEQIKVEDFNFIADPKKTRVQGLIAQDIYTVYPEAVSVGGDDPNKKPWAVDYGRLTPLLIKAVQELKADNDNLRAENAAEIRNLREEIKTLKASIH